jgi:hypothetical protein
VRRLCDAGRRVSVSSGLTPLSMRQRVDVYLSTIVLYLSTIVSEEPTDQILNGTLCKTVNFKRENLGSQNLTSHVTDLQYLRSSRCMHCDKFLYRCESDICSSEIYTEYISIYLPTFRDYLTVPSSRVKLSKKNVETLIHAVGTTIHTIP